VTEIRDECRQNGDGLVALAGVAAVGVRLKDKAISNKISEIYSELMHHFKCMGQCQWNWDILNLRRKGEYWSVWRFGIRAACVQIQWRRTRRKLPHASNLTQISASSQPSPTLLTSCTASCQLRPTLLTSCRANSLLSPTLLTNCTASSQSSPTLLTSRTANSQLSPTLLTSRTANSLLSPTLLIELRCPSPFVHVSNSWNVTDF
jgi:hypothetical protein